MKPRNYLQRFGEVELAVRQHGSGMPLVWGHGLLGSVKVEARAGLWDWDVVAQHAEVVHYDARGHGNSQGSENASDYHWRHMAQDMLAIADAVTTAAGLQRCVLGGLSMGAATALEAAVQQPDKVAGLILALPPTAWETRPRQAAIYRHMARISGLFGAAPYRVLDWLPIPVRKDGRSQLMLHTLKGLARANPLHVQAALRGAALSDMPDRSLLQKLDVPTLILAWEDDAAHPVSTATRLAETLPGLHSLVVSGPDEIADWTAILCRFLDEVAVPVKRRSRPRKRSRR